MLKTKLLECYAKQINERKIHFTDLDHHLHFNVRWELLALLSQQAKKEFMKNQFLDLKTELMLATAENVEIYEDMRLVHDIDGADREYVRDVSIRFKHPQLMYAIVEMDDEEILYDEDNIIMMSDCRNDLEKSEYGFLDIVELYVDYYHGINEYEHPSWDRIFNFAEKRWLQSFNDLDCDEPYDDF